MLQECLALVAGVCLNQNAEARVLASTIWNGAVIRIGEVTIESVVRTDGSGVFPDRRRMSRYCFDGGCIYYHVFCDTRDARYICRYTYNEAEDGFSRKLEIVAPDLSAMTGALRGLRIASPRGGRLFPLAGLADRSPNEGAPWCRPRNRRSCQPGDIASP